MEEIKKMIGKRIALYERRVDDLQRKLIMMREGKEKENTREEMLKWYWKDEEALEILREMVRIERGEGK